MAWLETKGEVFRIRFRYGGRKNLLPLNCRDRKEASDSLNRFEEHLRLIERGVIAVPPDTADAGIYILSGGKLSEKPGSKAAAAEVHLGELFDAYLASAAAKTKAESTQTCERTHLKHLRRLIKERTPVASVGAKTLQDYVDARLAEPGRYGKTTCAVTVKKEVATFAYVWNQFGLVQEIVPNPAPTGRLVFGKERGKPPFQTREQIERQLARGHFSEGQKSELWASLFLTLPEVEDMLGYLAARRFGRYVVPMLTFAAHTGARRSEILRSRIDDIDMVNGVAHIREKKHDTSREETYRTVPLSPKLKETMQTWLEDHPGGSHTFVARQAQPITRQWASELLWTIFRDSKWEVIPGWHCFRHSFISNCVAKGVDQRLIDQWVGHSTEVMRKRYSHLIPAVSQKALLSVFGEG